MSKALELLAKRLKTATEGYGRKAELCRATGMSASQVDGYIAGRNQPNLAVLERLAEHWGLQPWELIRPEGAQATPAKEPPAIPQAQLDEIKRAVAGEVLTDAERDLLAAARASIAAASGDDSEVRSAAKVLRTHADTLARLMAPEQEQHSQRRRKPGQK